MKRWVRYLALGIAVYVLSLIATLPASVAYAPFRHGIPALALEGLDGTVWSGSAAAVRYRGDALGAVRWHLRPLALLTGRAEAEVSVDSEDGRVHGFVGRTLGGTPYARGLSAELSVGPLAPLFNVQALRPEGTVLVNLSNVEFDQGRPVAALGSVVWRDAVISVPQAAPLGDLELRLTTQDGGIHGVLRDKGGPLLLNGILTTKPDGSYRLTGSVAARASASEGLIRAMRNAGAARVGTRLPINLSGRLP